MGALSLSRCGPDPDVYSKQLRGGVQPGKETRQCPSKKQGNSAAYSKYSELVAAGVKIMSTRHVSGPDTVGFEQTLKTLQFITNQ